MSKKDLTTQVQKLITELKIKKALDLLLAYIEGMDEPQLETSIIIQQGNYNRLQQEDMRGTIRRDEYNVRMARINYAILQILEMVPESGAESVEATPPTPDEKIKILFLTSNPKGTSALRLSNEIRKVKDGFKSATLRDKFEFINEPAVRVTDITAAFMQKKPDMVHFSGHGEGAKGIVVEGDDMKKVLFPTDGLKRLFGLFKNDVGCVVLNACYSSQQAAVISEVGIDSTNKEKGMYVVGMNDAIGDDAAIAFAVGFYQAIGEGMDYAYAYEMGMIHISTHLKNANKPELWFNGEKIK